MDLFADRQAVTLADPHVTYLPGELRGFVSLDVLRDDLPLEQKTCVMYGKTLPVPRQECWFSDSGKPYRFGGRTEFPKPWPRLALLLRGAVQKRTGSAFDSCFVNYYRDESCTIGWHADDDAWIGPEIASVSFGAARRFVMRRKIADAERVEFMLGDGDLLVMHAGVQARWLHTVPRQKAACGPRLNFTFRQTINMEEASTL